MILPAAMRHALDLAAQAAAEGEVPVGAVVVDPRRDRRRGCEPHAGRSRPVRPCRVAGGARGLRSARQRAAGRPRHLCHARALRHVRGGHLFARLRRSISAPAIPRWGPSSMVRGCSRNRPATTCPRSMAASARPRPARCCSAFRHGDRALRRLTRRRAGRAHASRSPCRAPA